MGRRRLAAIPGANVAQLSFDQLTNRRFIAMEPQRNQPFQCFRIRGASCGHDLSSDLLPRPLEYGR